MVKKMKKPVIYSALEVANVCGVVNQTAINWIRGGFLKAFKTPGGQYRVYPDDLASFMNDRGMRIPDDLLESCSGDQVFRPRDVLIVDDDEGLNSVVAKYLTKKFDGIQVYQAFDGFEAGKLMTDKHPGCIILDLNLPGVDGFELCRKINEDVSFGHPAIIVVTALQENDTEDKVHALGVTKFFKKPLSLESVADAVQDSFKR